MDGADYHCASHLALPSHPPVDLKKRVELDVTPITVALVDEGSRDFVAPEYKVTLRGDGTARFDSKFGYEVRSHACTSPSRS